MRSIRFGGPVVPLVSIRTRDAGSRRPPVVASAPGVDRRAGSPRSVDRDRAWRRRPVGHELGEVVGVAGEQRQVERGDVVAGAVDARGPG